MSPSIRDRLPLLRHAGHLVARQQGRAGGAMVPLDVFLAEIEDLASRLLDRPFVVNFCTDRYRFTVGLAAAMLRGQITLLPGDCSAAAVAGLLPFCHGLYALTDRTDAEHLPCPVLTYPMLASGTSSRMPSFPPEQIAAILFTSGSTGAPNPSPRSWGRLVAGTVSAGKALGLDRHHGAPVVATVPHAHSYGLESTVLLPLQHGLLLDSGRPFFPADVTAALAGDLPPALLVTTPVHLRALVSDTSPGQAARAGLVLSATAPLGDDLAARAETVFGAPVFEIYGCSEAGQLATRRTTEGPVWRCLDGFHLRQDGAATWASGPAEADVRLADDLELHGPHRFVLHGRTADQVNIAGKRSSLAHLTRQLTDIDGVQDGIFLMPAPDATGSPARLAAFVVAPGLDAPAILAALRTRIDPAFLPRPLHVVEKLPRNEVGKVTRAELLRVAALAVPSIDPALLHFPLDHPAGPGHFPGNPIIPGAVLLDSLCPILDPGDIETVKFHHPVRPGDTLAVTSTTTNGVTRFECRIAGSDRLVLSGAARPTSPRR